LQSWLAQEVLYRHALEQKLMEEPEVKKVLEELTRGVFSQQLMNRELASKINITETDLQTYYAAHKKQFIEPAKASISHILVDDEEQANDLILRIKNEEDFGELAKQFSKDEKTKEDGGKIEAEVNKGSYIPMIGDSEELNKSIFAANVPAVLDQPFKTEKGWEIVKVETVSSERQKEFDEVRRQVMLMLTEQKRQDVQSDFIEQMMDKYNVIIHTSMLKGAEETIPEDKPQ
jgi:parvulin-like peptidyl-prolyl isomerase